MKRVKDCRDYSREAAANRAYEVLRRLDSAELRIEARLAGIDPSGMGRQQIITCLIDKELGEEQRQ